jgi:hypothetical protein
MHLSRSRREINKMNIQRPRFLSGFVKNDSRLDQYERKPRTLRERVWRPNSFKSAKIAPRQGPDFDGLRALDEKNEGLKVQLGDATLAKLLAVQVPDPSDISWLTEKTRRITAGETPFGRKQRTITKTTNLADAKISTDAQIQAVQTALAAGNVNTAAIGATVLRLLVAQTATVDQITKLTAIAKQLAIPKDWKDAGLPHRLWSAAQFKAAEGTIMLFLLANIPKGFDNDAMFLTRVDDNMNVIKSVSIRNIATKIKNGFLDIENRAIIPPDLAKDLVYNDGVDNGLLDIAAPPPP